MNRYITLHAVVVNTSQARKTFRVIQMIRITIRLRTTSLQQRLHSVVSAFVKSKKYNFLSLLLAAVTTEPYFVGNYD